MPIFYVRGLIGETTKATVMLIAADKGSADKNAVDFGITGEKKVFSQNEWETVGGLEENEHFILGYYNEMG